MGFISMVALGALRGGHGGGHAQAGGDHAGPALAHGHSSLHGHAGGPGHAIRAAQPRGSQLQAAKSGAGSTANSAFSMVLGTLSPVNIFSLALGFGATGMILGNVVGMPGLAICAVIGAFVFNFALVRPLMGYLAGFASKPSEGIEGMVYQEAEAITGFDKEGRGIVRLTLDGQHVQLLATLDLLEVEKGIHVSKGQKLIVTEVDSAKNSCRVTRELAS
jgi:hypothetical protein